MKILKYKKGQRRTHDILIDMTFVINVREKKKYFYYQIMKWISHGMFTEIRWHQR